MNEDDVFFLFFSFQIILSCVINRDLQYNKVMPTFHHWRAGKQRNGLTFQTAADARAFDKGIIRAYDDLIDGELIDIIKNWMALQTPHQTWTLMSVCLDYFLAGINMVNSTSWSKRKYNSHVGEDDVFMVSVVMHQTSICRSFHDSNVIFCLQCRHWIYRWTRLIQDLRQKETEVKVSSLFCLCAIVEQSVRNLYKLFLFQCTPRMVVLNACR